MPRAGSAWQEAGTRERGRGFRAVASFARGRSACPRRSRRARCAFRAVHLVRHRDGRLGLDEGGAAAPHGDQGDLVGVPRAGRPPGRPGSPRPRSGFRTPRRSRREPLPFRPTLAAVTPKRASMSSRSRRTPACRGDGVAREGVLHGEARGDDLRRVAPLDHLDPHRVVRRKHQAGVVGRVQAVHPQVVPRKHGVLGEGDRASGGCGRFGQETSTSTAARTGRLRIMIAFLVPVPHDNAAGGGRNGCSRGSPPVAVDAARVVLRHGSFASADSRRGAARTGVSPSVMPNSPYAAHPLGDGVHAAPHRPQARPRRGAEDIHAGRREVLDPVLQPVRHPRADSPQGTRASGDCRTICA